MSQASSLARYSLWQLRDFAIERGLSILIIGVLWGYALIEPIRRAVGSSLPGTASPLWLVAMQVSSAIVSVSVLIALNGIVSADRKAGYYRFLFSKPVNPVLFYAQVFFVYMVGVIAAMFVLSSLLHKMVPTFSIPHFLLYTALVYIAMGGIGFFLSVTTRYDWLSLAAVWLGARVLRGLYGAGSDWRSKLVEILPPVHRLDDVANSLIATGSAHMADVVWLFGYGALFFVLGLAALRWGQLAD
ncbi:MAG TPA: hypothetical protein VK560_00945 [Gemmatimonadaceae bacterium]|jgi:hypothetical protein|nr:hypothetical protein [Gemmatimonadaceae bacterium]